MATRREAPRRIGIIALGAMVTFGSAAWLVAAFVVPSTGAPAPAPSSFSGAFVPIDGPPTPGSIGPHPALATEWWANVTSKIGPAPAARANASLVFDPVDGYSLLFGGSTTTGGAVNDSWLLENGTWSQLNSLAAGAPSPRSGAATTYDPTLGGVVLFGGEAVTESATVTFNATWVFSGAGWNNRSAILGTAPPALAGASLTFDPLIPASVLYGGVRADGSSSNETWLLTASGWSNRTSTAGAPSAGTAWAGSAFDPIDGVVLVVGAPGGIAGSGTVGTWTFNGSSWRSVASLPAPSSRTGAALAFDGRLGAAVLFGGSGSTGSERNDTWAFVSGSWTNVTATSFHPPGSRTEVALGFDPNEHAVVLFGGRAGAGAVDDTWVYGPQTPPDVTASVDHDFTEVLVSVNLTATPSGNGTPPYTYYWDFGDTRNATGQHVEVTYGLAQNYPVVVTITDAVGQQTVAPAIIVHVFPRPTGVTITASMTPGEVGVPVAFSASAAGGTPPYTYAWTIGTTVHTSGADLNYTFSTAGNYSVNVSVIDALGGRTHQLLLEPIHPALSSYIVTGSVSEAGRSTDFAVEAQNGVGPYAFNWTMSDGFHGTSATFSHVFAAVGSVNVSLVVTDALGVRSTNARTITVNGPLSATAAANVSMTDLGLPVQFTAAGVAGTGPYTFEWAFGDGATSTIDAPVHAFYTAGAHAVTVTTFDAIPGITATASVTVQVNVPPSVAIATPELLLDVGAAAAFNATVAGGTGPFVVNWTFGDGATAAGPLVHHGYAAPGTYHVHVTVLDAVGQSSGATVTLEVAPPGSGGGSTGFIAFGSSAGWTVALGLVVAAIAIVGLVLVRRRARRRTGADDEGTAHAVPTGPPPSEAPVEHEPPP